MEFILTILAPIFGGLILGSERVLKAKMQRRVGPPLLQPFFDLAKLLQKRPIFVNEIHIFLGIVYFFSLWAAVALIFFGANLLYPIFVHLFASIIFVVAGFSVKSPYSHLGSIRELLNIVAYEPLLILVAFCFYFGYGSFEISKIVTLENNFLLLLPTYILLMLSLPAVLKKAPFDMPEAHQEVIGGIEIEYSGIFYEIVYGAKFLEFIFIYSFIFLLSGNDYLFGIILSIFSFLVSAAIQNSSARVGSANMFKILYPSAFILAILNFWILL